MACLCWTAVTLSLLLSSGYRLVAGDQNKLEDIVDDILNMYTPSYQGVKGGRRYPMFSLALSIPYNSDRNMFNTTHVSVTDPEDEVRDTILKCEVYTGVRVVAATVLRWPNILDQCPGEEVEWPHVLRQCGRASMTWADVQRQCPGAVHEGRADHAEYRTPQHFNTLTRNLNRNDLLLFYVLSSPCDKRCASQSSPWSILSSMKQILKWKKYAVVFSNVFMPRSGKPIPEEDRREALYQLGRSVGLNNIYRCTGEGAVQCTSCSSGNRVTRYCYSDDSKR